MKKIFFIISFIAVINVWAGFIDTYDECNMALDVCLRSNDPNYRSAASACVDAGGIWTGQKCPQFGGDWCKNKCEHGKLGLVYYITTAKGCGICKFINDSIDSAYSKTGQFKAGTEVPFAATFVHRKLCSVNTGTEAINYMFGQEHTDSTACKWVYWNNPSECPNPEVDTIPYTPEQAGICQNNATIVGITGDWKPIGVLRTDGYCEYNNGRCVTSRHGAGPSYCQGTSGVANVDVICPAQRMYGKYDKIPGEKSGYHCKNGRTYEDAWYSQPVNA